MRGCKVFQAEGVADVDITKAAVNSAQENSTTLNEEVTDLLVLFLHYAEDSQSRAIPKVFNIDSLKSILGSELCIQLLFLHAFTGCDSASRIYAIGKKTVFQKLLNGDRVLHSCASAFTLPGQNPTDIMSWQSSDGLQVLWQPCVIRHLRRKSSQPNNLFIQERLPPSESSTKFHCLRVYY
ncbi:hypothetical protein PR048_018425 [Dryococelus australis]|uniref:Uncharacterized protein n=1 Tax=Dryococelus australis TaxID=614101 RepID=A0ABQ9HC98_9NEOP|nr:hypothetical protein PR048_018425 [Dryococelus australis]